MGGSAITSLGFDLAKCISRGVSKLSNSISFQSAAGTPFCDIRLISSTRDCVTWQSFHSDFGFLIQCTCSFIPLAMILCS